jgi:hypothetical protein
MEKMKAGSLADLVEMADKLSIAEHYASAQPEPSR